MMSRWPWGVSIPTVVPWTIRPVSARSRRRSIASSPASSSRPDMTPSEGSAGVEADLASVTRPASCTATRSVNVPPTSMPMRNTSASPTPARRRTTTVRLAHEAVLPVGRSRVGVPLARIAIPSAAGRLDEEQGAGRNGNAELLGLEDSLVPVREHHVAVRQAVAAAEYSVGGMAHAVAGGVAPGRLRGLHAQVEHRADSAAQAPVARRARPELVALEEQGEARLRDLDAAELDSTRGLALARRLPSIAGGGRAAAAPRVEEMPDEAPLRPGIDALDGDAKPA